MPKSRDRFEKPDRRSVVRAGSALVAAIAVPNVGTRAAEVGLAAADDLLARVNQFFASLEPEQRKIAVFAWDGSEWRGWNYFGSSDFIKPGLRLEQMTALQKAAAWDLLSTFLSANGLEKAKDVMRLQDVLAARGDGIGRRSSERFSFTIFGVPAERGAWGFRLEGHHLSLSIAVRDGRIISVTPSSFSANPNRVQSGVHAGLVTLKGEEALARRLFADLSPRWQARARLSDSALRNILSYAGRERANAEKVGLAAADLGSAQRDLLWQLIDTYTTEHLWSPLASAQKARVTSGDREAVHFAWYGPNTLETAFGYRVIGDGFVIEMGSVDQAAQHLHTIYHDLASVLGRSAA
jgi:Protein of unknown function (DUF3500)